MQPAELSISGLRKHFGGVYAIDGVDARFAPGSVTAIIGPNGAGKTTLVNLITAKLRPDAGTVSLDGVRIDGLAPAEIARRGVGRAFQIAQVFGGLTTREALAAAFGVKAHAQWSLVRAFPHPEFAREADAVLRDFDLSLYADTVAANLPHGARKLLDLALVAAIDPAIMLLDEPAAGLGHEGRARIVAHIRRLWDKGRRTIVLIEHDMDIVFGLAQHILVLNFGKVLAQGTPEEVKRNPKVIEAYLGEEAA